MSYKHLIGKYIILKEDLNGESATLPSPKKGSVGLVTGISKTPWENTLDVKWISGSSLSLLVGTDEFEDISNIIGKRISLASNLIDGTEDVIFGDSGVILGVNFENSKNYNIKVLFDNGFEKTILGEKDNYIISGGRDYAQIHPNNN